MSAALYDKIVPSLGLPARVAVGFTPGEQDDAGIWRVRGEFAHAWPEVDLAVDAIRARFGDRAIGPAALRGPDGLRIARRGAQQWGPDDPRRKG